MKKVKHSYSDVSILKDFFDKTQNFQYTYSFIDDDNINRSNAREKAIKKLEELYISTLGYDRGPLFVNVVTFSGHGITFDGDAIAVIPK